MKTRLALAVLCSVFMLAPALSAESAQPKALSSDEIQGLLAGKGMGFAKAAELNNFPGPRHLLDLQEELALSPEQISQLEKIFASMQADARRLGSLLVAAEGAIEQAFAQDKFDAQTLSQLVMKAADLRGQLRLVHLEAHVAAKPLIRPEQAQKYYELRRGDTHQHGHHHHHHN